MEETTVNMESVTESSAEPTAEERFEALIRGEFKPQFDERVRKIVEGRLKALHRENEALRSEGMGRDLFLAAEREAMARERQDFDALLRRAVRYGAQRAGQDIARSLSGGRVAENGGAGRAAAVSHVDPARLSPAERADIRRRVARGERVKFN